MRNGDLGRWVVYIPETSPPPEIFLTLFPFLPFILVFPVARLLPEPHKYMIFNG